MTEFMSQCETANLGAELRRNVDPMVHAIQDPRDLKNTVVPQCLLERRVFVDGESEGFEHAARVDHVERVVISLVRPQVRTAAPELPMEFADQVFDVCGRKPLPPPPASENAGDIELRCAGRRRSTLPHSSIESSVATHMRILIEEELPILADQLLRSGKALLYRQRLELAVAIQMRIWVL